MLGSPCGCGVLCSQKASNQASCDIFLTAGNNMVQVYEWVWGAAQEVLSDAETYRRTHPWRGTAPPGGQGVWVLGSRSRLLGGPPINPGVTS